MTEDSKINALVNIGQSKVVEKAYDDVVSPPAKKVGTTLSTILDIGNTALWPIKWANERVRIFFENNLKKYEERLNKIDEHKLIDVPTEISIPILERFKYVSNSDLSNAFVHLLATASSSETIHLAHPGFIPVIDRLSPDEARILKFIKENKFIIVVRFVFYEALPSKLFYLGVKDTVPLEKIAKIEFLENMTLYFENLRSLGLITNLSAYEGDWEVHKPDQNEEADYLDFHSAWTQINEVRRNLTNNERGLFDKYQRAVFALTDYGKMFILSCID